MSKTLLHGCITYVIMRLFRAAIPFLVTLGAISDDVEARKKKEPTERKTQLDRAVQREISLFERIEKWTKELETILKVNTDPVLRAIICRVAFTDYSLSALMMGSNIPADRFKRALTQLEHGGFIKTSTTGDVTMVAPANPDAKDALRRFAMSYCSTGGECGVRR